jgi:hypothetical protein
MLRRALATAHLVLGPPLLLGACELAFPLVGNDGSPDGSSVDLDGGTPAADAPSSSDSQGEGSSGGSGGDGANDTGVADGGGQTDGGTGPTAIYSGLEAPLGIALNGTDVCWVAGQSVRGLFCAPTSGGGAGAIRALDDPSDPLLVGAFDLALDGTYVYWSNGPGNQVVRKALSGGTAAAPYFSGDNRVSYIAVTGAAQVWASDYVAPDAAAGALVVGPAAGGTSTEIYPLQPGESGVAVLGSTVYWGRSDVFAFGPQSGNVQPTTIASPGAPVGGVAVDAAGTAYFIVGNQKIYRLRQGSITPELVYGAASPFGDSDIAVDATAVYFSQHDRGTIMRMGK